MDAQISMSKRDVRWFLRLASPQTTAGTEDKKIILGRNKKIGKVFHLFLSRSIDSPDRGDFN